MKNLDRVLLAEAMGGEIVAIRDDGDNRVRVSVRWPGAEHGVNFDPLTDANDDVRVNEWATKNLDPEAYFWTMTRIGSELPANPRPVKSLRELQPPKPRWYVASFGDYCYVHEYRTGYFAHAALAVLEGRK